MFELDVNPIDYVDIYVDIQVVVFVPEYEPNGNAISKMRQ